MKTLQELIDAEVAAVLAEDATQDAAALQAALLADAQADASVLAAKDAQIAALTAEVAALEAQVADLEEALEECENASPPGDTIAPSFPTGLTATVVSDTQINLTWNASTDNVGVTSYEVFRNNVSVGTPTGTSFSNTGLTASTTYTFSVKAKDAAGNVSASSSTVSATTQAVTPPATGTWPKGSTTGVKPGIARTTYTGPTIISAAGTVVANKNITGTISVTVDGVKFQNCMFTNFSNYGILGENRSVIVEDCTFDGRGSSSTKAIAAKSPTVRRCNIFGMVIAIDIWGGPATIEDNYIHDLAETSSDPNKRHFDGVVCRGGGNVSIKHNAIDVSDGTACVFLTGQEGQVHDVRVENNLLLGQASYPAYAEASSGGIVRSGYYNNYIERGLFGYILNDSGSADVGNIKWKEGTDPTPAAYTTWKNST